MESAMTSVLAALSGSTFLLIAMCCVLCLLVVAFLAKVTTQYPQITAPNS
jgi:hypothetical protein